ncbi:Nuf2 family protein [Cordyceps javanica]|uniref:Nuf2 family protein n=1 Tax=Cordyceps javanica TaxID=43265 RepID=A0A545UKY5_9HYPO|nr:Nuf2 family protein [Cordyceps javanica]
MLLKIAITSQPDVAKENRKDKRNVQPKNKPTRHSQMFWAGFACGRRTSLVSLFGDPDSPRRGVTSRQILACLQENLPTIAEPGYFFVQDNAPTHTARLVKNWLREWAGENGIQLVEWPPYSPDLNPIENLWKLLKEQILKKDPGLADMPKTDAALEKLIRVAEETWEEFSEALLEKLATSMVRRLQAVLDADGWYTKY